MTPREHDDVHAQVGGGLLCRQTGAQTVVEEDHQQRLVFAQMLEGIAVFLDFLCFCQRAAQVTKVFYIEKCFHS